MHACMHACVCSYVATELVAITVPHSEQPQDIITIDISFTDGGFTESLKQHHMSTIWKNFDRILCKYVIVVWV